MAFTGICIFVVLLNAVSGNPLGQTTVCETSNLHPTILPGLGTTTVCESAPAYPIPPNLLGLGYGYLPYPLGVDPGLLPYSYLPLKVPAVIEGPSSTVCETVSNVPVPTTTVCESVSNVVPKVPLYHPRPLAGSTTVCESAPSVVPGVLPFGSIPLPYPGLFPGLSVSPFGVNLV